MVGPGRPDTPRADFTLSPVAPPVLGGPGHPRPRRDFLSTEHLSTEAIAAYADRALPATGAERAKAHLAQCPDCLREVAEQRDARAALRRSGPIRMPDELRSRIEDLPDVPGADVPSRTAVPEDGGRVRRAVRRLLRRTDV